MNILSVLMLILLSIIYFKKNLKFKNEFKALKSKVEWSLPSRSWRSNDMKRYTSPVIHNKIEAKIQTIFRLSNSMNRKENEENDWKQ